MNDVLERFFKSIDFFDEDGAYKNATIDKVVLNKKSESFEVVINNDSVIPVTSVLALLEASKKGINGEAKVKIKFNYKRFSETDSLKYFNYFLDALIERRPSLVGLSDANIKLDDEILTVQVTSKVEADELKKEGKKIVKKLVDLGLPELEIITEINKEAQEEIKKEIKADKKAEVLVVEKPKEAVFIGRHVDGDVIALESILGDQKNIIIEAYIFGIDTLEKENINIITLKVSDNTNSMLAKIFQRDKDEFKRVMSCLSKGKWYRINGNVEFDNFSKDLVISIRSMESIDSKESKIEDTEEVKRVELHAHTIMSAMDGVISPKDLVKFAKSLGHKALAVTDHNCVQSYPDLYNAVVWDNKKCENEEDKFKILYGVELSVVNDDVDVVFNEKEYNLLEDEFVVFDTETTGFHPGTDQMIEIGAVKIKGDIVSDRFDMFIDPKRPIPKKITELTNITDEMLKGQKSEEEVTKLFLEWAGDLPMVAHNAKFDKSFMESAMGKYNLGTFENTVVDTMSLARILFPEWPNHKLQTLTKRLKVDWDEESHHRADYDAEGTAQAFNRMAKILDERNIETTTDIYKSIDTDELIKFSFPFHMSIIATNQIGLKNLFKIVSLANTKYLFRGDQPKIPRHEIINNREGLLIGSGCINGEIFENGRSKEDEELSGMMQFYDYIEVQPVSAMSHLLELESSSFHTEMELQNYISRIIKVAKEAGKLVVATGDVHNLTTADKKHREIIVVQKTNGRFHPLNRREITIPDMKFLTTTEMLEQFSFLDKELAEEIVITNTNKISDMIDHLEIIKDKLYTPKMDNSEKETEDMVYKNAHEMYGDSLPSEVEERIKAELNGIISNGYAVLYLIAQKLVKKSNDDGYFVGSRGSVGSSFVATMMGITEVNPLPPHFRCPKCKKAIFGDDNGPYTNLYKSGFDMPDRECECGERMIKDGQDMPFSSFLGYNADKVPDIDLNFSGEYQAKAHDYTKVLFGEDKVFRAGTISTVAEKTAFGYVKGYCEEKGIVLRNIEIERLAQGITGVKRTTGQHPGGIIVIPDYLDVFDFTPYQYPAEDPNSTWYTTHFDFHAIHDNVLKLDILGHDDPTMLKRLGDTTGIDIMTIPFDDKKVISLFSSTKALEVTSDQIMNNTGTLGIPESGTGFVMRMLEDTKPKNFAGLVKVSGLSHGTGVWAGNAKDLMDRKIATFDEIIGCREELITKLMGYGMDGTTAFKITEFVRKSYCGRDAKIANPKWAPLKEELTKPEYKIPEWFITSCETIEYMFPKAHATAYVMMALRVAWFKVYYPLYYYSAFFSIRCTDFDVESMVAGYDAVKAKILEIMNKGYDVTNKEKGVLDTLRVALEMLARGYSFKMIDIEKSEASTFVIDEENKTLILPFRSLDGLGDTAANKVVEERASRAFISVEDFGSRGKVSQTLVDKMRTLGVLEKLPETSQLSLF